GHQGAGYPQLGAAWGITRQSARTKWPDAVPSRAHLPQPPVPVQHAGGTAAVLHQPDTDGLWMFTALAADGTQHVSPAEYTSSTAAAHDARAFLAEHPAGGTWTCEHCGAGNPAATPYTCGFCNHRRERTR
ncbi:hypothetical protein ABZW32_39890, partial [Streptomyces sp. NPDC004667]